MATTNDYTSAVGLLHFALLALASFRIAHMITMERRGSGMAGVASLGASGAVASAAVFITHWFVVDPAGMYRAQHGTGWPVVVWWLLVLSLASSGVVVLLARVVGGRTDNGTVAPHDEGSLPGR